MQMQCTCLLHCQMHLCEDAVQDCVNHEDSIAKAVSFDRNIVELQVK
jgi:hypothetical protein